MTNPPPEFASRFRALVEVILIAWVGKHLVTRGIHVSLVDVEFFGWLFAGQREILASAVLRSMTVYVVLLGSLAFLFRNKVVRDLLANLWASAERPGWYFAAITAGFQTATILAFFVRDLSAVWEPSWFNLYMSVAMATSGGFGEELLFRGYVIMRLRAGGVSTTSQIIVSGALFSIAHMSWSTVAAQTGSGLLQIAAPLLGTFVLGMLFARAFQLSGYRPLPVIAAHAAINLVIEPALVLSYFGN
ncbi:MAG: CPBP family intramembrane metalloprotease [Acidobacteria bacterium]|nr:CPBP family intramembrane metalloprotease [Acidobacteriota bacterium]